MVADPGVLSPPKIDAMMRAVIAAHSAKLDRLAAANKMDAGFDADDAERDDLHVGWAYRLLDGQGSNAVVRPQDRDAMTKAGFSDADVEFAGFILRTLQSQKLVPTPRGRLEALLNEQGVPPTSVNMAVAQQAYYRAISLALFNTSQRYRGEVPNADDIVAAAVHVDRLVHAPVDPALSTAAAVAGPVVIAPPAAKRVNDDIVAVGEKLVAKRAKDENWSEKTQKQARQIYKLMRRFMIEERELNGGLASLAQEDLAAFVDFLANKIYKHYGKSLRDEDRTIAELLAIAATMPTSLHGVAGVTLNRHLGYIAQLFDHAPGQGISIAEKLSTTKLRSRGGKKTRARHARAKMPVEVSKRIFQGAPFMGCAAWDKPYEHKEGGPVFHRALYYVPMLLEYTGTRREESCGLDVDNVFADGPIPYIRIIENELRRIKNEQSVRDIPLHPELLRLKFLEYVAKIRSLGYKQLFPDLYSPSSKSPLGDRFYDEFMPEVKAACEAEGVDAKVVLHSVRHGFNSRLKKKVVSEEERADLMGHAGDSETSERYADPVALQRALKIIKQLPNVTAHLQPQPIRLLPWVENREVAPFSRAARRQKRVD